MQNMAPAKHLGYVVNFDLDHIAKNGMSTRANDKTWGLGVTVVLSPLDDLAKEMCCRVKFSDEGSDTKKGTFT